VVVRRRVITNIRVAASPRLRPTVVVGDESVMVRRGQRKEKAEKFHVTKRLREVAALKYIICLTIIRDT
jgi:hypothetical protein